MAIELDHLLVPARNRIASARLNARLMAKELAAAGINVAIPNYRLCPAVRIEDMVLVTKDGCRNLTDFPKVFELG